MQKPSNIPATIMAFIITTGVMLLFAFLKPYGTANYPIATQALMWGTTFLGTTTIALLTDRFIAPDFDNYLLTRIVSSIINLVLIIPWVLFMIQLFTDISQDTLFSAELLSIIIIIFFVIALPVEFVSYMQNKYWAPLQNDDPITTCPLNKQLPPALHGAIILGLRADDHYVHIITDKGTHMLLSTLSDCITHTEPMDGVQVHRSYWVARMGVKDISRIHGRYQCTLTDGTIIPISRSGIKTIRDVGWIS